MTNIQYTNHVTCMLNSLADVSRWCFSAAAAAAAAVLVVVVVVVVMRVT